MAVEVFSSVFSLLSRGGEGLIGILKARHASTFPVLDDVKERLQTGFEGGRAEYLPCARARNPSERLVGDCLQQPAPGEGKRIRACSFEENDVWQQLLQDPMRRNVRKQCGPTRHEC